MDNFGKLPYEISIWDDTHLDNNGDTLPYFREKKIAIIASDTMDTPIMAFDKNLTESVNGSYKLTFKMYYKYNDGGGLVDNPFIPYMVNERKVKLLYKNKWYEFLIKDIREESSTYTFTYALECCHIIELSKNGFNLEFDAQLKNNQGTAPELGQAVVKDTNWQLIDSNGYIDETTQRNNIVDDQGRTVKSDCIIQETKEALFEYTSTGASFYTYTMSVSDANGTQLSAQPVLMNIPSGDKIYVFYSVATTSEVGDIQFIYNSNGQYTTDSERNITNGSYFLIRNSEITRPAASYGYNIGLGGITLFTIGNVSEQYRGIRYVISKKTKYDPLTDKYVDIYTDSNDEEVYVYTELATDARENILNCISNYKDFRSTGGWKGSTLATAGTNLAKVEVVSTPDLITIFQNSVGGSTAISNVENYIPLIKIDCPNVNSVGFNTGMFDNRVQIKSYSAGQKFHCILRAKIMSSEIDPAADGLGTLSSYNGTVQVASYEINENGACVNLTTLFEFNSFSVIQSGQYVHAIATCAQDITEADAKNLKIGIFFKIPSGMRYIYLEEAWIYREVLGPNNQPIIATSQPTYDIQINTRYKGYRPSDNVDITDKEKINWCCDANSEQEFLGYNYKLQTNDNSQKILSITAKESNYFNLIQTICETFECWARFTILHNADGSVKFEEWPVGSGKYRPCKYITLHKYVGQPQYAGFRYGVNLNSIQRTLVSSSIVTKLIVKNNKNKYAPNGFCAVGLAQSNPTKQNALFNFDNYINTGLLDAQQLYYDLWDDTNGIGYYKVISAASKQYDDYTAKIEEINSILYPLKTQITEAEVGSKAAAQKIQDSKELCVSKFDCEYEDFKKGMSPRYSPTYEPAADRLNFLDGKHLQAWCSFNGENLEVQINGSTQKGFCKSQTSYKETQAFIASITTLQNEYLKYMEVLSDDPKSPKSLYDGYEAELNDLIDQRKVFVDIIEAKDKEFYNKYYRYIQEGTWIDESYVDHEKYYLDAVSTLYNSCQPQVTYDVKVIDLAALDEYKGYECHLGDKTYIEDTEFFGYVVKNGIKTPYQEEIVITELVSVLDNPSKNTIKVQTKKTQFQDLFRRITATVQSVKFSTGAYDRAADMVTPELTLNTDFLQASFDKNAIRVTNAANETVEIGDNGITSTNKKSPNNIVRIISGGIYMSRDGGETWELGISPEDGINTHLLRAGQIDTALIQVYNGAQPAFRWDASGINAYNVETYEGEYSGAPPITGYDYTKAVRFDRFGIYGFQDLDTENFNPTSVDDIYTTAGVKFALTWKGFMFHHTRDNEGSIYIGDLDGSEHYGISICQDVQGQPNEVFRADEAGNVSITGVINAQAGGKLGNWDINNDGISATIGSSFVKLVPPTSTSTDKVLQFKYNDTEKFSVDSAGNVYAGNINAAGGVIGGCTIDSEGNLRVNNVNIDGVDITKIISNAVSEVTWPSKITATNITVSGNGTSKIAGWYVKGNKLYHGAEDLTDTSHVGICLDAGDSNNPSGILIYENTNNYFKFSTNTGLEIKCSDGTHNLYINNGNIWSTDLKLEPSGSIKIAVFGDYSALNFISYGSVDITASAVESVTIATKKLMPGGNNLAAPTIGDNAHWWTTGYFINTTTTNVTATSILPTDNTGHIGDSNNYWNNGYFTTLNSTTLNSTTLNATILTPVTATYSHIGDDTTRWGHAYFRDLTTSNQPTVDSDMRLKSNISTLSPSFKDLFDRIEVKSYNFINEVSQRTHLGVIAQEVVQAIKDSNLSNLACVSYNEESDKYSVAYGEISMLHLAHYKDFLKSYTNKIASLEKEISELRKEIQNLQKS